MSEKLTLGWREWVALPDLAIPAIKAKVDTGARTSALHAIDIEPFTRDEQPWVRFAVHPVQKHRDLKIQCEAPVVEQREIMDSGGHRETRFVVNTQLQLGAQKKLIELTLTCRYGMRFRMLLGRTALKPDVVCDPGTSYKLGRVNTRKIYRSSTVNLGSAAS
ncbi:MAG: ATP-dependent zinc protease [Granulosicoccus sp.]|nr:ATP-dependent zinc protease [Granulosicoccus sp.]